MKRILFPLCVALVLLCCACGLVGDQRYVCDIAKVDSIEIVRLDKYVQGEYRFEHTVLSQVSDCDTFVSRLNRVDHSVNWGDPGRMKEGYIVIRIDYRNGDFDLIYSGAQWFNRSGVNQNGYFFFDVEQFEALISEYIKE